MTLWQNIPFVCILLPLGAAAVTSVLKRRAACICTLCVLTVTTLLCMLFVAFLSADPFSYTYSMGHYPAPWGNEIRAGLTEAVTALLFALIMLISLTGGLEKLESDVLHDKQALYFVILLLLTAALMAQVYTNDIFTGYVFVEIMTLAACGLITARSGGKPLVAATRYMVMNLLGSGLFLLGTVILYDLTGHLLMSHMKQAIAEMAADGSYHVPLTVAVALITVGLSVKSALFPFHTWVPAAYGHATPTSAAVLSSLVCKGYIFLLLKILCRVIGMEVLKTTGIFDILFVFALTGMIWGSIRAIHQQDLLQMVSWSSVAQIGYIFAGIGLGTVEGSTAAMFYLFVHTACKSMLFLASDSLATASGGSRKFRDLRGAGFRAPLAGVAFSFGALCMVGFPFTGGFIGKLNLATAGIGYGGIRMILLLSALVVSTLLNVLYFMRTVITLYRNPVHEIPGCVVSSGSRTAALILLLILNLTLGLCPQPLITALQNGMLMFG